MAGNRNLFFEARVRNHFRRFQCKNVAREKRKRFKSSLALLLPTLKKERKLRVLKNFENSPLLSGLSAFCTSSPKSSFVFGHFLSVGLCTKIVPLRAFTPQLSSAKAVGPVRKKGPKRACFASAQEKSHRLTSSH